MTNSSNLPRLGILQLIYIFCGLTFLHSLTMPQFIKKGVRRSDPFIGLNNGRIRIDL
ncbi:MAG: hypothetical protein M5F18_06425 [Asgard group archaeon]|nr:hypothetical protein [Asgard group archaeon]